MSPNALADEFKLCQSLVGFNCLICFSERESCDEFVEQIDLWIERGKLDANIYTMFEPAIYMEQIKMVEFRNGSRIYLCTDIGINRYDGRNIHSVLLDEGVRHYDAISNYTSRIVKQYSFPENCTSHSSATSYVLSRAKTRNVNEIDTSQMDRYLAGI